MPACEPIVREPANRRPVANERPATVLCPHQPFAAYQIHRLPDRPAGNAVAVHQRLLARKLPSSLELAPFNGRAQMVSDLLEDRTVASRIDGHSQGEHLHSY